MRAWRVVAGLVAVPVGMAALGLHRWATGREAVLDVTVRRRPDLYDRDVFLRRLRRAGSDPRLAAVLLRLQHAPAGWAASQDLRDVIGDLRRAGKPVYAWLESPGNAPMWLASACDRVFLAPTGDVGLVGVGVELTFFGAALGRLGIRPDFEAAGAYKSFGEPWTRSFASPANQEAVRELVDDLHEQLVDGIAQGRGREPEEIRALLARAPLSAEDALKAGLVDQLGYQDELEEWIKERHGKGAHLVPFAGWAFRDAFVDHVSRWGASGAVVSVLHLQGPVVMEEGSSGAAIAARKVVPLLERLREDDEVSAVVLHVDSPGGSALASDLMWREVDLLRRAKPVVAVFEDVAASGGFYLAAPAHEIVARAGTLTGSIGVFGGKLVAAEGLRRAGVHSQEVLAAPNANLFSGARHFTDDQRVRFRESLQRFYDGFVRRVADGRGKTPEEIEPSCQGRVWTGRAADQRGLVDQQGGLELALERARTLAGLHPAAFTRRDLVAHHASWWSRLLQGAMRQVVPSAARLPALAEQLLVGRAAELAEVVVRHPGEPLALLPFDLSPR